MAERYMALDEFKQFGYLQEVNRQFLHPLGLALAVLAENRCEECDAAWDPEREDCWQCGNRTWQTHPQSLAIWDCRDDPEGINFSEPPDTDKVERVGMEFLTRAPARAAGLGYIIQPYESKQVVVNDSGSMCDHCLSLTQTTLIRTCAKCGAPKHA